LRQRASGHKPIKTVKEVERLEEKSASEELAEASEALAEAAEEVGEAAEALEAEASAEVEQPAEEGTATEATEKPEKPKRQRSGPSDADILKAMKKYAKKGTEITSTLLKDHFKTKTRQVIRTAMKGLAKDGKIQINEVGEEGKRKHFVYELVA